MKLSFAPVSALTAVPPINSADLSFTEIHKRLTRRTGSEAMRNQIQSLTNGWECTVDLGSAGQFLSTDGFSPPEKESFGGFTVFMFNPTPHKVSEAEMSKRLDSLIHDPKMNAQEWVKDLKTFKYYFPKTVDEVHHMMSCAIEFLNLLAGTQDSIATRGYTDAIEAVNINRHGFKLKQSIDPAFLTKVLYLVETEQQNVYTELLDSYQANPIFPLVPELSSHPTSHPVQVHAANTNRPNSSGDSAAGHPFNQIQCI
jgi:hypothetical protein